MFKPNKNVCCIDINKTHVSLFSVMTDIIFSSATPEQGFFFVFFRRVNYNFKQDIKTGGVERPEQKHLPYYLTSPSQPYLPTSNFKCIPLVSTAAQTK
jgi:hypothetical protein